MAYRFKPKSLTALYWINPRYWKLSKEEVAKFLGVSPEQVRKATCLQHQVSISWVTDAGNVCSSFFSYRLFGRWEKAVLDLIAGWQDPKTWHCLFSAIEYEFVRFDYPTEMADWIWENLKDRDAEFRDKQRQQDYPNDSLNP
jgi:hypothetical protein